MQLLKLEFVRYVIIGIFTTAIHYALLIISHEKLLLPITVSTVIGFIAAVTFSYAASYSYTFNSSAPHKQSLPKFLAITLLGLLLNIVILNVLYGFLGVNLLLSFLVVTVVVTVSNFVMNKHWSFK